MVWRWEGEPFGNSLPNEDVDGDGQKLSFNLRFPGQYYDQETGRFYNFYRDYNPATGRYVQSDPIGLNGGPNTFAYVEGNPISGTDPLGLYTNLDRIEGGIGGGAGSAVITGAVISTAWGRICSDAKDLADWAGRGWDALYSKARDGAASSSGREARAASGAPDPEDRDYKRPNEKLEKGDRLDLDRFSKRVKVDGEVRFEDPKSGY